MVKIEIEISDEDIKNILKMKNEETPLKKFVEQIVRERVSFVYLDNGFYYNVSSEELYNKFGNKIRFTKTEKALFNYLVLMSLKGESIYVNIETIKKDIWKNDDTTIFSIRNKINSIRNRTYDTIIKNKSNHGYRINLNLAKDEESGLSA